MIFRFGGKVSDIALHPVVMTLERSRIACEEILLPSGENEGAAPLGRIAKSVGKDDILRRDVGHESVVELGISHVVKSFRVERGKVEFVPQRRTVEMILFEPAQTFAVGTIGDQTDEVAALRPPDERADAVEEPV